jgi:3-oxoacyl-[acyl-carrier protein] reductase
MRGERPRHILITGGGRGLGHALAAHCVARGDVVSTCSRSEISLLDAARHRHYVADISDAVQVEALFASVRADVGYLDALVNNAGTASMNVVALTPPDAVRRVMRINAEGPMLATHFAVRLLRRSPAARIVNVSTVAVPLRLAGEAVYAASKSAIETFTRVTARELGALGITCNAVGPSPIRTDLLRGVPANRLDKLIAEQAVPRWATVEDFVNVVEFFLAPASGMVTGQVVYLGGAG